MPIAGARSIIASLGAGTPALQPAGNALTGGADVMINNAFVQAAATGKTVEFGDGTFWVSNTVHVLGSYTMTPNTVIKAAANFPPATPVGDTPLNVQVDHKVFSGGTWDANNIAFCAFWAHYATHCSWLDAPTFRNATLVGTPTILQPFVSTTAQDFVLGDPAGTPGFYSYGNLLDHPQSDRTLGAKTTGSCNIHMTSFSTDNTVKEGRGNGQECGIWDDNGNDNNYYTPHYSNSPVVTFISEGSNSDWIEPIADTPQPVTHAGAAGTAATNVITDPLIQAIHQGLPVTGANIGGTAIAPFFVGAVTPGVSFTLVTATGVAQNPAGVVAGITLQGVGINLQTTVPSVIGGNCLMSTALGVDNACYGICMGPLTSNAYIHNFSMWAQTTGVMWIAPLVGRTGFGNWMDFVNDGASCHNTYAESVLNTTVVSMSKATLGATSTAQAITSGASFLPNANKDTVLSFAVTLAGTMSITMGPTGSEQSIYANVTVVAGAPVQVYVPANYKVVVTLTTATISAATKLTL